jgi:hypothetical protein
MMQHLFSNRPLPSALIVLALVCSLSAAPAHSQSAGNVGLNTHSGDISGSFGYSSLDGVDNKKHFSFGGSAGVNFGQGALVGEYNYQSLGSLTDSGVTGKENLQKFGVAARISFTSKGHVVPYLLGSGGYAHMTASASAEGISVSASQSGAYAGGGGGASIYFSPHWGIRPEFRFERETFAATTVGGVAVPGGGQNDMRGTCSLFYQWGGSRKKKSM